MAESSKERSGAEGNAGDAMLVRPLGDREKWLITEFLTQRERERDEQRDKQHQRWTRTASLAAALLGAALLAGGAAFLANLNSAALAAVERALGETGYEDEAEQEQIKTIEAAAILRATSKAASDEAAELRTQTRNALRTVQALAESTRAAQADIDSSRSLVEAVRQSAGTTDAVAKALLEDEAFRASVIDRLAVPRGTIAFFALQACPVEAGWREYEPLRGRYAVGLPSGGELGKLVGQSLTDGENRPTGRHTHRYEDQTVGHRKGPSQYLSGGGSSGLPSVRRTTEVPAGSVEGTNAPYVQLLACRKE